MNKRITSAFGWTDPDTTPRRFTAVPPPETVSGRAKESANSIVRQAGEFIGSHPAVCLATAATCGVIIGWLVKRRT